MKSLGLLLLIVTLLAGVSANTDINFIFADLINTNGGASPSPCPSCSSCSVLPTPTASPIPSPSPSANPGTVEQSYQEGLIANTRTINILHFNDVYTINGINGVGGVARAKTVRDRYPDDLLIFSGDCLGASLLSTLFRGQQMVDTLNQLNITLATAGNHEFDFGIPWANQTIAQFNFPWMLSNIVVPGTDIPIAGLLKSVMIEHQGVKIGFFGVASDWRFLTQIGVGADFINIVEEGGRLARQLRAQGAELIIAVTHSDYADDDALVSGVPEVDLVLGGHDHDLSDGHHKSGVLIWKSAQELENIARLTITLVKESETPLSNGGTVNTIRTVLIPINTTIPEDPQVNVTVNYYLNLLAGRSREVVAVARDDLVTLSASVRTMETNFGNWVADRYVENVASKLGEIYNYPIIGGANGGSIRSNTIYTTGHNITFGDIQASLPFGDQISAVIINGTILKSILENSVSIFPVATGRFLQISGFKFVFSANLPVGSRVINITYPNGTQIKPEQVLIYTANSFEINGGDGYTMIAGLPQLINAAAAELDYAVAYDYLKASGELIAKLEGRITSVTITKRQLLRKKMEEFEIEEIEAEMKNMKRERFENKRRDSALGYGV